jgi:hypothetical protein
MGFGNDKNEHEGDSVVLSLRTVGEAVSFYVLVFHKTLLSMSYEKPSAETEDFRFTFFPSPEGFEKEG